MIIKTIIIKPPFQISLFKISALSTEKCGSLNKFRQNYLHYRLTDIFGNDVRLYYILDNGKHVLIVTWALWAKQSIKEIDEIRSLNIQTLGISMGTIRIFYSMQIIRTLTQLIIIFAISVNQCATSLYEKAEFGNKWVGNAGIGL